MKAIVFLLRLPWLARIPSGMGLVSTILSSAVLASLATERLHALDGWQQAGVVALVIMVAVVWIVLPNTLWVARDASTLRIPHAGREVDRCLLLHAGMSILVPAFVLGLVFGHLLTWLVSLTLVASAAFALNMLPIRIVWGCVLVVMIVLFTGGSVPLPGDPRYLAWAIPAAIVLGVACMQRWSTLRRTTGADVNRGWAPGLQAQRLVRLNALRGDAYPAMSRQHATDDDKRRHAALPARIGPEHPVDSIRLAINPMSGPNAQRTLRWSILCGVLAVAVLWVLLAQHILSPSARAFVARQVPLWCFLFLSEGISASTGEWSRRSMLASRWRGRHGELPLLALLPKLGRPGAVVKRSAVFACLHGRALWLASVLVALALIAAALHMPDATYPILLVVALSGLAMDATITLYVLAGRPLRGPKRFAPRFALLLLLIGSSAIWTAAIPDATPTTLSPHGGILVFAVLALWSAWLLVLAILAWRGWRLLQHRPHPFLANPQT